MLYSVVIPVYNRPDEVRDLLQSLTLQTFKNFEVLIIEDGSTETCRHVIDEFTHVLDIRYFYKENSGQGFSRNYGFERAKGDYFIVFDSDCIIPPAYLETVESYLARHNVDAFGGPDMAHPTFTPLQKAISYSMTSPFTTGGIRGNKHHAGTFHPRSFNMGISRKVYEETGGYRITRMGEDIEFSIRIIRQGFKTALIPDAGVWHKRRTNLKQFFDQLYFFGRARVNIGRFYPDEIKPVHVLPFVFLVGFVLYLSSALWHFELFVQLSVPFGIFAGLIFLHSAIVNRSVHVAVLSVVSSVVQLSAYGAGFVSELFKKLRE